VSLELLYDSAVLTFRSIWCSEINPRNV